MMCSNSYRNHYIKVGQHPKCVVSSIERAGQPLVKQTVSSAEICNSMSKEAEQKIDNVFVYEDKELKKLQKQYAEIDKSGIDLRIAQSEALLRSLGYELPTVHEVTSLSDT